MTPRTQRALDFAAIAFVAVVIAFSVFVCANAPKPIGPLDLLNGAAHEATGQGWSEPPPTTDTPR